MKPQPFPYWVKNPRIPASMRSRIGTAAISRAHCRHYRSTGGCSAYSLHRRRRRSRTVSTPAPTHKTRHRRILYPRIHTPQLPPNYHPPTRLSPAVAYTLVYITTPLTAHRTEAGVSYKGWEPPEDRTSNVAEGGASQNDEPPTTVDDGHTGETVDKELMVSWEISVPVHHSPTVLTNDDR